MPAYVVVDVDMRDAEAYKDYRAKAPPIIAAHGGRYITRGGAIDHVEPGWDVKRFVMLEFPSMAAARKWYSSPEYQKILPIRLNSTKTRMMFVEGIEPGAPLPA